MRWQFVAARGLRAAQEQAIRALLVATFPQHAALFSRQSYWGSPPTWRLCLQDGDELIAHTGFGERRIRVGTTEVSIAGIGAVAVHPRMQRCGLGRALFAELHRFLVERMRVDFGFLECREAIVPFYVSAGFTRFDQIVHCLDPDSGRWEDSVGPKMVLPACQPLTAWPAGERIDLRGMPW